MDLLFQRWDRDPAGAHLGLRIVNSQASGHHPGWGSGCHQGKEKERAGPSAGLAGSCQKLPGGEAKGQDCASGWKLRLKPGLVFPLLLCRIILIGREERNGQFRWDDPGLESHFSERWILRGSFPSPNPSVAPGSLLRTLTSSARPLRPFVM